MKCTICNLQYVGKNQASFNIRLNIHRKEVKDPTAINADKHFQESGYAKYTITDRLRKTNLDKAF